MSEPLKFYCNKLTLTASSLQRIVSVVLRCRQGVFTTLFFHSEKNGCKKERFRFYGPFKNISLISSRSLIRCRRNPGYPEKNHLAYRCRTWHLTCVPSEARTTAVRDPIYKSQRSYPLDHGGPYDRKNIRIYELVLWSKIRPLHHIFVHLSNMRCPNNNMIS